MTIEPLEETVGVAEGADEVVVELVVPEKKAAQTLSTAGFSPSSFASRFLTQPTPPGAAGKSLLLQRVFWVPSSPLYGTGRGLPFRYHDPGG